MECVRCIERRETMPNQLEEGKLYWLDEDSKYIDPDGDTYATIYRDAEATKEIGVLHIKHFRTDYKQIKYGLSLNAYLNTNQGILLEDIIDCCVKNAINDSVARNILKYIKDRKLDTLENMQKEFLIKSNPLKYYEENGRVEEYAAYFGYSVEMRE